jgi:PEP-CTERM motif
MKPRGLLLLLAVLLLSSVARAEPIYYLWEGTDCTLGCHEKATAQFTLLEYTPGDSFLVFFGAGPSYLPAFRIGDDTGWQFISVGGDYPGRPGHSDDWIAFGTLPAQSGVGETQFSFGAQAFGLTTHTDGSWFFFLDGINAHLARGLSHTFTRLDAPIPEPSILLLLAIGAAGLWLRRVKT